MATRKRPRPYKLGLRTPESDATRAEWGGRLRVARERLGMYQRDVAERIGCTRAAVSAWERGISAPSLETRRALARALKQTVGSLFPEHERAA